MADDFTLPSDAPAPFALPSESSAPAPQAGVASPDALESAAAGMVHGATAGWSDELSAAGRASGLPPIMSNIARVPVGAARLAYEHLTGQPGPASAEYDRAIAEIQKQQQAMQKSHPIAYGGGDLAGAGASMFMLGPEAVAGAALPARLGQAAKVGAGYGAASGASQGAEQNGLTGAVGGAGIGAVEGALGGAGGELGGTALGRLGSAAYGYVGKPIASALRGLVDPAQEAARRVAGALFTDYPQVAAGKSLGLTPIQWAEAKAAGEPVMLADLGGETTRALMRSAANTSPEGRAELNAVVAQRYADQNDRAGMTIRSLVDGGADTAKTKAQLEAEYDAERGGAYKTAYDAGDRPIWSPELERLTSSPSVAGAIRGAVNRWKDFQVKDGYGGMNPPVNVTPDGQLQFLPGKGMLPYPNLQFWDYASRNLAGMAAAARRAGNNTDAGLYGGLETQLKGAIDKEVPKFKDARGIASQYFGGNNAIEAGQQAINFKGDVRDLQRTMAQMKPAEREMFQESYADALARKAESTSDNQNITNKLANSLQDRARIGAVLGPQSVDRMGAFVLREKIYDAARQALGNSTTVRQMMEAGLAGGVGGMALTGDPRQALEYGIGAAGVGAGAGASGLVRHGVLTGARTALGYVDRNTAARVAGLLASDDPQELMRGLQIAAKNQRVADGLRQLGSTVAARIGAQRSPSVPPMQFPGIVGAQGDQQNVPGPVGQKNGGSIVQQRAKGGKVDSGGHVGSIESKTADKSSAEKATKTQANYRGGQAKKQCSLCDMFRAPSSCTAVQGRISPRAVCDFFERKRQERANGGRVDASNIEHAPSEAQKEAGNYAKDHVRVHGLDISIENAKGHHRRGVDRGGKAWSVKMPSHYGYIKGTVGKDKDHVDVYLGPHLKTPNVWVLDQMNAESKQFDEHKTFVGFASKDQVVDTYRKAFSDGKAMQRLGHLTRMTVSAFKDWLESGNMAKTADDHFAGAVKIDATHDGPWMSCMSIDGGTMYRNKNIPEKANIKGKTVDVNDMLLHHEVPEREDLENLIAEFKKKFNREPNKNERKAIYLKAHNRSGTPNERAYARKIGVDWKAWSAWCRGEESKIEKGPFTNQPKDADVKPIPHSHDDLEAMDHASAA